MLDLMCATYAQCMRCAPQSDVVQIDMDTIETSNLNRQFLFRKHHVGESKAKVAAEAVKRFRPEAKIQADQVCCPIFFSTTACKHFEPVVFAGSMPQRKTVICTIIVVFTTSSPHATSWSINVCSIVSMMPVALPLLAVDLHLQSLQHHHSPLKWFW
jgi:hypothetical protein